MSNVRPKEREHKVSTELRRENRAAKLPSSRNSRAFSMLGGKSRFARAVRASPAGAPVPLCYERAMPSRARAILLAKRSIQNRAFVDVPSFGQENVLSLVVHEVSRSCTRFCPSTSSEITLVAKRVAAQRSWWRQPRPNPSVEGMAKRLRLLATPHLER